MNLKTVVSDFVQSLQALIQNDAHERTREHVLRAFGYKKPGRPPGKAMTAVSKPRKKPPRQICPVPGCKNTAAPIFGMVCADHKNVAKSKIRKYREARKAKKLGLSAPTERVKVKRRKEVVRKTPPKKAPSGDATTASGLPG